MAKDGVMPAHENEDSDNNESEVMIQPGFLFSTGKTNEAGKIIVEHYLPHTMKSIGAEIAAEK